MRVVLLFVSLIVVIGTLLARSVDKVGVSKPEKAMPMAAAATVPSASPASSRTTTLRSDGRGHFEAEARVDGRYLNVLVDTGASMIALRESSAARLGIFPTPRDYSVQIQTANGTGRAARVQLNRVQIGDVTVRDVEAFVVPDEALTVNLLGMSFLSRVKWTHDRGRLVLEQ